MFNHNTQDLVSVVLRAFVEVVETSVPTEERSERVSWIVSLYHIISVGIFSGPGRMTLFPFHTYSDDIITIMPP